MFYQPTRQLATCAHLWPKLFPLTNKLYQLLLTAPTTVASDERTFSQLKKRVLQENKARQILKNKYLLSPETYTRAYKKPKFLKKWQAVENIRDQS